MRKAKDYWKDIDNVKKEIEGMVIKAGKFPTFTEIEIAKPSLSVAITKYHGGMYEIRKIFNEDIIRRGAGYWDRESIKSTILEFSKLYGEDKVKYKYLREYNYHGVVNAMKRQGISLKNVCEELGIGKNFTEKGYLKTKENVIKEYKILIEKYGCIPPREIMILEGKSSLPTMVARHYGGMGEVYRELGIERTSISSLEEYVKNVLSDIVDDKEYIDNAFSKLKDYGVILKNPKTGNYLQLDRYYYNRKIAIEVQGRQHYIAPKQSRKDSGYTRYTPERVKTIMELDDIKRKLLSDQGITLIEIKYSQISVESIKKMVLPHFR